MASFRDDLEATWDMVRSVPGAFGNVIWAALRQVNLLDIAAFSVVIAGLAWLVAGWLLFDRHGIGHVAVALTPLFLWLTAGIVAGFIFHIGAVGKQSLAYWEAYALILLFGVFGILSLRLALDPRDRRVFHTTVEALEPPVEPTARGA